MGIATTSLTNTDNETTYLISGAYKGDAIGGNIVSGTTPNDILTFAHIQADIIGVIIVGFLLGVFLRYFHNKIMRQNIAGIKFMLYSYFIVRFIINLTLLYHRLNCFQQGLNYMILSAKTNPIAD